MKGLRFVLLAAFMMCANLTYALGDDLATPPTPTHFVTDNASALSESTRSALESQLSRYQRATGHQVIVWIGQTTGSEPLESWTASNAHRWKIGRKGKDDGAVLFIFMRDHKIRIEVGYGLEGSLTDADSKRIIDTYISPKMRAGNVDEAVSSGVNAMLGTISPSFKGASPAPAPAQSSDNAPLWAVILFIIAIIAVPLFLIALIAWLISRTKKRGFGKTLHDVWFWGGGGVGSSFGSSSGSGFGGFGGGGFSAGGGSFGGGGASGGW